MATTATDFETEQDQAESTPGTGGWQQPPEAAEQPIGSETPCTQLGKRHRWKGGDTCLRCGTTKSQAKGETATAERPATSARVATRTGAFETLGALLWGGIGIGLKMQPVLMTNNAKREDGTEVEGKPIKDVVGNAIILESAMAGKRIDKALHHASPFWYNIAAKYMKKFESSADLAPLFLPPMFVYGLAAYPQIVGKYKAQITGMMLPIFIEIAKLAKQQNDVLNAAADMNDENIQMAVQMMQSLFGENASTA